MTISILKHQNKITFGNQILRNPYNEDNRSNYEIGKTFFTDVNKGLLSKDKILNDRHLPGKKLQESKQKLLITGNFFSQIAKTDGPKERELKELIGKELRTYA